MNYIEIIIVINLVIHNLFIVIANYVLASKKSIFWIIVSNVIDVIYLLLYMLYPYEFESFQYLFILLISIIPFIRRGIRVSLLSCIIYLALNFMLGGTSKIIYYVLEGFYAVIISIISITICFVIVAVYKKINIKVNKLNYEIIITDKNRELFITGFCDTGNLLTTEDNIPIVFLDYSINVGRYKKRININTVSVSKSIDLYVVDSFKIKVNKKYIRKDVYIAFSNINTSCMFGLYLLGG